MGFGERALALEAGRHRCFEQFNDCLEFRPRAGIVHALADIDQRTLCRDQRSRGRIDVGMVRSRQDSPRRLVVDRAAGNLEVPHVAGDFEQHRAGTAIASHRKRAAQRRDDHVGRADLFGLFDDVLVVEGGVEAGAHPTLIAGRAAGNDDQRHAFGPGLGDRAERVLDSGTGLAAENADLLALAEAADGIGHVDADTLLADDDRANSGGRGGLGERVQRIGQEVLGTFSLENFGCSLGNVHRPAPFGKHERVEFRVAEYKAHHLRRRVALVPRPTVGRKRAKVGQIRCEINSFVETSATGRAARPGGPAGRPGQAGRDSRAPGRYITACSRQRQRQVG